MLHRHLLKALAIVLLGFGLVHASTEDYLSSLRVSAAADPGRYRAGLGAYFEASGPELDHLFQSVKDAGDAALCMWLARKTGQPVTAVTDRYHKNQGKGWGALAQSLGIKPGSAEFKALKAGEIGWDPPSKHKGESGGKNGGGDKGHKEQERHGGKDKGGGKGKNE